MLTSVAYMLYFSERSDLEKMRFQPRVGVQTTLAEIELWGSKSAVSHSVRPRHWHAR